MTETDVLIIGAGASGLAAAVSAAEAGDSVTLLERYDRPGKKLLATGNGRCNLLNSGDPVYYGEPAFAQSVLNRCGVKELTRFWNRNGLFLREETEGRVYPFPMKATAVLDTLLSALETRRVSLRTGQKVLRAGRSGDQFVVQTETELYQADRLIVSTGGPTQPRLGGNRDGYGILCSFGHSLVNPVPALTPLITDPRSVSGLSGIRVRAVVSLMEQETCVHKEKGEVLFTDDGVSGICVMQCARFAKPGESDLLLDLTDGLFGTEQKISEILKEIRSAFPEETPEKLIGGICLPKLAFAVCKQAGLAMRGEKNAEVTDEQLDRIAYVLKHYCLHVTGRGDFDTAQVSAGGICCDEFRPETMESRLCRGLHATGEVLNVDGACGGFNLMFAFATGILAGKNGRNPDEY